MPHWRIVLKMAWPLIIANSFWNLQLTIDRIFLGAHSTEALGAAMAVMGVFWVPMALLQQTAAYVTTFIAQYYGAGRKAEVGSAVWQAIYVSAIGGVLFLIQNYFSADFFALVGHAETVRSLEVEYFNSVSYSALPTALVAVSSGFFTGLGRTRTVIGINFVGLLGNAVLDYAMIFGNLGFPKMGVAGAGYATAIGTYLAAAYGFYLLFSEANESEYRVRSARRFDFPLLKQFLRYGLPSGCQWALEGLAFTVFLIIMGRLPQGEAALASSSIAVTIMMISVLPSLGVAQAVLTLVGQKLGERKPTDAETYTYTGAKLSSIYMAAAALSFVLAPGFYLSWFRNDANPALWAEVVRTVPHLLQIVAVFTLLDSLYLNFSFALKGAGDTRFVSLIALTVPWPLMVLPAFLVREWDGAIFWAWRFLILYSATTASILLWRFRQGKWKNIQLI